MSFLRSLFITTRRNILYIFYKEAESEMIIGLGDWKEKGQRFYWLHS